MLKTHLDDSRFDADLLSVTHGDHGVAGANGEFYQAILPKQEVKRVRTRFNCAPILNRAYDDCALSPQPRAWPNESACDARLPSSTRRNPTPLTVACDRCEDGVAFHGNNPAGGVRCAVCDGAGVLEVCCCLCGEYGATDRIGDEVFHLDCAEEVLADMHHVMERMA